MRDQAKMRALIMQVHSNPSLTPLEKAHEVQKLMTSTYNDSQKASNENLRASKHSQHMACLQPHYRPRLTPCSSDPEERISKMRVFGCKHYARACKIQAPCCHKWYTCRLCHDEDNDHKMNRHEVRNMYCMHCNRTQEAGKVCKFEDCRKTIASYHCGSCNLWDDDPMKKIYHCDECGLCRIGEGLGKDFFHCKKCNVCMAVSLKGKHKCIERNLESNCPICSEFMFTSTSTIIFMKCGHCIHHSCYRKHVRRSYQCPICMKSLGDMKEYFEKLDEILVMNPMPVEYKDSKAKVLCNDCEVKSETSYHFMYHKCNTCTSFNTTVLTVEHGPHFQPHVASAEGLPDNMLIDGGE
eukprot:CFRG3198T1